MNNLQQSQLRLDMQDLDMQHDQLHLSMLNRQHSLQVLKHCQRLSQLPGT